MGSLIKILFWFEIGEVAMSTSPYFIQKNQIHFRTKSYLIVWLISNNDDINSLSTFVISISYFEI